MTGSGRPERRRRASDVVLFLTAAAIGPAFGTLVLLVFAAAARTTLRRS